MADAANFTKLVPGFDFLQGLVKNAGAALPNIGQWVAPTLNPEELEKRIEELRTVQFWLEQNARMLGATIQALEVQRMTLSTLKTMNRRKLYSYAATKPVPVVTTKAGNPYLRLAKRRMERMPINSRQLVSAVMAEADLTSTILTRHQCRHVRSPGIRAIP